MAQAYRILAVDDNPRNLAILTKTLAGEFDLVTATSGEQALEIASHTRPDLILLDIMMPGIDGYETCRRMRACRELVSTKILMVSAKTLTSDRVEGYAAGADDYVTKPFDQEELVAKLRVYLRLKSIEEVDRLKSDLLGLLSHETRTPLTAILTPAALLLEDSSLTQEQRSFAEMIKDGGMRLLSLVEKVAFLSQLKAGLAPRESTVLDAEVLATHAIACARVRSSRADVAIELANVDPVQIEGDASQLESAVEILLDNAMRLSPVSGVVRIDARQSGPWSSISVTDQGPGIHPDFIRHVFDEFTTENVHHHSHGHGLSLATARLIVEQHGGSLTVESEPGRGAIFKILLPAPGFAARAA